MARIRRSTMDPAGRTLRCTCRTGPRLTATWRNEQLVSVERIHWGGRDRCPIPAEQLDLAEFRRQVGAAAAYASATPTVDDAGRSETRRA